METFVQDGNALDLMAPSGGVMAGTAVKINDILVVPTVTAAAGARFVGVRVGVVEHAKLPAEAWTEGQQVNWDDTEKRFTTVTTGNFRAGVAAAAAANPSATGKVLLHGVNLGAALS